MAVKCTFDIRPDGSTEVAKEQPPVLRVPEYIGEPAKSSLKHEADLVLTKATTDVVVIGHAYAPEGRPLAQMEAGFRVGPVQKIVRASATGCGARPARRRRDRSRRCRSSTNAPSAAWMRGRTARIGTGTGGIRSGTGYAVLRGHLRRRAAERRVPERRGGRLERSAAPAGFGPIGSHWSPASALQAPTTTLDEEPPAAAARSISTNGSFSVRRKTSRPRSSCAAASPSCCTGSRQTATCGSPCRSCTLGFDTHFIDGSRGDPPGAAGFTRVILEPDFPRLSLVWHTALAVPFQGAEAPCVPSSRSRRN